MRKRSLAFFEAAARWPPAIAIAALVAVGGLLPERYGLLPEGLRVPEYVLAAAFLAVSVWAHFSPRMRRVERAATIGMLGIGTALLLAGVVRLTVLMFTPGAGLVGPRLLSTGISLWTANLVCFALWYWALDHGPPDASASATRGHDFMFARPSPEASPGAWTPGFIDYVFVAFNTSVAFSPTDTTPLSSRAKVLMMMQASVSLVTVAVVVARAVNLVE
jgi:hypothetical protein